MTKEEADLLLAYYDATPEEVTAMKREIGLKHPAVRYIEALELACKFAESDIEAMTEEEDEHLKRLSKQAWKQMRGIFEVGR